MTYYHHFSFGLLKITASEKALKSIHFTENESESVLKEANTLIHKTMTELSEYLEENRKEFSIPIKPEGTDFQQSVWKALQQIPYGQTRSYGELAAMLGDPSAVRAVGKANGQNPIPIIIPCHRVIGSNKKLVGYSGGIERKKYLLKHEGAILI